MSQTSKSNRNPGAQVIAEYVDFKRFGGNLTAQLEYIAMLDVHVAAPGTGMMLAPFLREGAAHMNMGGVGFGGGDGVYGNPYGAFRNFMEQNIQAGTPYIRSLYYETNPTSMVNSLTQQSTPIMSYCENRNGRS